MKNYWIGFYFLNFCILAFLSSCASNSVGNFKDADFSSPPLKKFSKGDDFLNISSSEIGILSHESAHKSLSRGLSNLDDSENLLDQGLSSCYKKKFSRAGKIFKKLYRTHKKYPVYWNHVGSCRLFEGNRRKALIAYNKSKSLAPKYSPPVNNLGVLYQMDGEDQKALLAYKKARGMNPFARTPLFNLGNLYTKYGFFEKAKGVFNSLLNKDNSDADALAALGYLYLVNGDYKTAIGTYLKIDDDYYENPRVGLNYAMALYLDNQKDKAKDIWDDVDRPDGEEERAYYERVGDFINNQRS